MAAMTELTQEAFRAIWNGPIIHSTHLTGWKEAHGAAAASFQGRECNPHSKSGAKLMARWRRENKRGDYGKGHIRSEFTSADDLAFRACMKIANGIKEPCDLKSAEHAVVHHRKYILRGELTAWAKNWMIAYAAEHGG